MRKGNVLFVLASAVLTAVFLLMACVSAFCQDFHALCGVPRAEWEIEKVPCIRVYRTIYPSDYIAAAALGMPVRNFHYWDYDMTHVHWIPPAAMMPAVPGHEDEIKSKFNLPMFPGQEEEADKVPELKKETVQNDD